MNTQRFKWNNARYAAAALLFVLLTGCAGMHSRPLLSCEDDAHSRGFRYYEASPYLLVQTDNDGGLKSQIIFLPDETKKQSIRPFSFMASITITLDFDRGILSHGVHDVDETVVPAALVSALEKAAAAVIGANTATDKKQRTVPAPYLFKILIKGNQVELAGGQPDMDEINFGGDL